MHALARAVGHTLIDSSMAIGQERKNPGTVRVTGFEEFSETDSPLALFYVVAISFEPEGPKSIHVSSLKITRKLFRSRVLWQRVACGTPISPIPESFVTLVEAHEWSKFSLPSCRRTLPGWRRHRQSRSCRRVHAPCRHHGRALRPQSHDGTSGGQVRPQVTKLTLDVT
jgi:hypothetical protein